MLLTPCAHWAAEHRSQYKYGLDFHNQKAKRQLFSVHYDLLLVARNESVDAIGKCSTC